MSGCLFVDTRGSAVQRRKGGGGAWWWWWINKNEVVYCKSKFCVRDGKHTHSDRVNRQGGKGRISQGSCLPSPRSGGPGLLIILRRVCTNQVTALEKPRLCRVPLFASDVWYTHPTRAFWLAVSRPEVW